jgi:SAM-dependent methyltransferase
VDDSLGREEGVYGRLWDAVHAGYFSDPAVARPLLEAATSLLAKAPADVVIDLGGGTGFLLSQLAAQRMAAGAALVNVDCSEAQLALTEEKGISRVHASVGDFRRGDIAPPDKRFFYLMRSVLHYFGQDGLSPLLRHLRDQAREGELFLRQTASFDKEEEAACLNALYRHMHTHKWYPTVNELRRRLAQAGWPITVTRAAPTLLLTSEDLGERYALDPGEIQRIRDTMALEFGEMNDVFELTPSGFQARLHYQIYTCVARS